MASFWKNIFSQSSKKEDDKIIFDCEEYDSFFAEKFTTSGGYFNYESSLKEGLAKLKEIVEIHQPEMIFCIQKELQASLQQLGYKYQEYLPENCDMAFINCECLVVFDGSLMISSNNIKSNKLMDLPKNIIVIANPSQIVKNKSEGLECIRKNGEIPNNITSLIGKKSQDFLNHKLAKDLYLLLVENI